MKVLPNMTYRLTALKFEDLTNPDESLITDVKDLSLGDFLVRKTNSLECGPVVYYYPIVDMTFRSVTIMYHGTTIELNPKLYIDGKTIWLVDGEEKIHIKLMIPQEYLDVRLLTKLS